MKGVVLGTAFPGPREKRLSYRDAVHTPIPASQEL